MALTRDLKETVKDRADRNADFRNELLTEALEAILCGDVEVAKLMLRDYIAPGGLIIKLIADNYAE